MEKVKTRHGFEKMKCIWGDGDYYHYCEDGDYYYDDNRDNNDGDKYKNNDDDDVVGNSMLSTAGYKSTGSAEIGRQ